MNLQYRILKFLFRFLAAIPRNLLVKLAFPIGMIWYAIDSRHRRIAEENMRIAFGAQWDRQTRRRWVRSNFIQLARVSLEIPSLMKLNDRNLSDYVTFSGIQNIMRPIREGKPLLILTAHFGNWELMALAWALRTKHSCHVVARPIDYAPMARILTNIRSGTGNQVLDKDDSQPVISRLLRENGIIGILLDQNASWYEGVYVPFFGRIACTNKGLALFALRYGAQVVPAFNYRLADGRYKIIIEPPVDLVRTGDITEDILVNTEKFNRIIERYIRLAPDNWFWVHRRWRIIDIPESHRSKFDRAIKRYAHLPSSASAQNHE